MTQITDNAEGKFELWFFRDMNDAQRLKLFSLFGLPTDEISTLGAQKLVLRRILSALISSPGKDGGQEVEAVNHGQYRDLIQALSRLAGNRQKDGTSSLVSREDREAIINGCHDLMIAARSPQPASTVLVERMTKALERLENCCDQLAGTRTREVYDAMINSGQAEALINLDNARLNARNVLALSASQSTSREGER